MFPRIWTTGQKIFSRVAKAGAFVGSRSRLNFIEGSNVTITVADDSASDEIDITIASSGGSGAPTDADYLVGTANAGLSAEIVVGTSPGGELGGTWASPTVDTTHSGSAHHSAQGLASITAPVTRTNDATEDVVVTTTIAANAASAGTTYKITLSGYVDLAASAPNLQFKIYLNGTGGTALLTHLITTMNTSGSAQPWWWEGYVVVRTTGAPGTCIASSRIDGFAISSANAQRFTPAQGTSSAITTSSSNTLDVTVKWASAVASNKWQVEQATIELVKQ